MHDNPISLVSGHGSHVVDSDGNEYLDFFAGIATTVSGHNMRSMLEAIRAQSSKILHSSTLYLIEPMVELAELLLSTTPSSHEKAFFVNSGTEAVDTALMLATNYSSSNSVVSMTNAYHGRSFAAVAVTGLPGYSVTALSPFDVQFAPYGDSEQFERLVQESDSDIAAVIVEPIQGVNGFDTPPDKFLHDVRRVCDSHQIVLISDEVQTGFGRTGEAMWGIEAAGVEADLMVMAKGLGNGLPIGAVTGSADIMNSMPGGSISTFGGNHLVTSGALANLQFIINNNLMGNAREQGHAIRHELESLGSEYGPIISQIRGKGLMQAVVFADEDGTARPDLASSVQTGCKDRGLLVGLGGVDWNVVRLAPPLIVSEGEVQIAMNTLRIAINEQYQAIKEQY
jgi:4-aminobutyrate aminotransferase